MKTLNLTLKEPVTFDQETISEIHIPKLKAKYARKLKVGADGTMELGNLLDVAEAAVADSLGKIKAKVIMEELGADDMMTIIQHVGEWLNSSQETGAKV